MRKIGAVGTWLLASTLVLTAGTAHPGSPGCDREWRYFSLTIRGDRIKDRYYDIAASSSGDVWAVGGRGDFRKTLQPLFGHWDGKQWHERTLEISRPLWRLDTVVAVGPDDVWATGTTGALVHWNGQRFDVTRSPTRARVELFAVDRRNVWALASDGTAIYRYAGDHWVLVANPRVPPGVGKGYTDWGIQSLAISPGGQRWALLVRHDLTGWRLVRLSASGWKAVALPNRVTQTLRHPGAAFQAWLELASTPFGLYLAGTNGDKTIIVSRRTARSWADLPPLAFARKGEVRAFAGTGRDDVWASVFAFYNAGNLQPGPVMAHWDGLRWHRVALPATARRQTSAPSVAVAEGNVWVTDAENSVIRYGCRS